MFSIILLQVLPQSIPNSINWWFWFLTSIFMQWFYYGLFTGVFFMLVKSNRPNMNEVYIGKRIGNQLHIHTQKQVSNKKKDYDHSSGTYILAGEMSDISVKRFAFVNRVYIFDEDSATAVIGFKGDMIVRDDKGNALDFSKPESLPQDIQIQLAKGEIKSRKGKLPIRYNVNPMWALSATKLHKYFKEKMIVTTWQAIIVQKLTGGSGIIMLLLGLMLGALITFTAYPMINPPITQIVTRTITASSTSISQTVTTITSKIG